MPPIVISDHEGILAERGCTCTAPYLSCIVAFLGLTKHRLFLLYEFPAGEKLADNSFVRHSFFSSSFSFSLSLSFFSFFFSAPSGPVPRLQTSLYNIINRIQSTANQPRMFSFCLLPGRGLFFFGRSLGYFMGASFPGFFLSFFFFFVSSSFLSF